MTFTRTDYIASLETAIPWRDHLDLIDVARREAIAIRDVDTLRTMLLRAMVFARHTIQRKTHMAEREYLNWLVTGKGGGLYPKATETTITSAKEFVATLNMDDFEKFETTPWLLAETIEANVKGLGVAKASFSAALFGMAECYCIDIWGTRHVMDTLGIEGDADKFRSQWSGVKARWTNYRKYGDAVFGNREGQWAFFESADPTFEGGGHAAILDTILNVGN